MKLLFTSLCILFTFQQTILEAKTYNENNIEPLSTLEAAKKLKWEIGSMVGCNLSRFTHLELGKLKLI